MTKKGITVSQRGIDVRQATDAQKVLDSRFRYYEIAYEGIVSVTANPFTGVTDLYEHKLGFLPAFDCYDITGDRYVLSDNTGGLRASDQKIYFQGRNAPGINYANRRLLLRIYNVPITEEYQAPIEHTFPAKPSAQSGVGIKSAIDDFRTQELSKYTINTTGKTLSVQKTGLVLANSGTSNLAVIRHDLGYPPTFLSNYADAQRQWVGALNPSFMPVVSSADGSTLTFRGAQSALSGTFAYIIFKELADFTI